VKKLGMIVLVTGMVGCGQIQQAGSSCNSAEQKILCVHVESGGSILKAQVDENLCGSITGTVTLIDTSGDPQPPVNYLQVEDPFIATVNAYGYTFLPSECVKY
jgi:hypothetical protein